MEIQGTLTQGKWLDFNNFVQLVRRVTMISNYRTIAVAGGGGNLPHMHYIGMCGPMMGRFFSCFVPRGLV